MKYQVNPSPEEAIELLNDSYCGSSRQMATIVGCCKVEYSGRTKSFLDYGDRLIIIKADGTLIVHVSEKREPVNWQPPGSKITFSSSSGLIIETRRTKPVETMNIHFSHIHALSVFQLDDAAELNIIGEEEDLVNKIVEDPSVIEPGLRVIRREKITNSGYIDLFCQDTNGVTVIVEVKRASISTSAVHQLEAYLVDFRKKNNDAPVRGILCAPKVSELAKTLINEKGLEYRQVEWNFELKDKKQRSLDFF